MTIASSSTRSIAQEAPPAAPTPPPPAPPQPDPAVRRLTDQVVTQQAVQNEQGRKIRELEQQLATVQSALAEQTKAAATPPPTPAWLEKLKDIRIGGYVQAQLENHEDSDDQLRPGGAPLNQNRFVLRRARLSVGREYDYAGLYLELDGNTTKGPSFGVQRAEASLMWRDGPAPAPAPVKLTAGLFNVPFGYELVESSRERLFMERTQASRAIYPSEPDVGAKISGEIGWLRYDFAFLNGNPLGEPSGFAGQDPNNHKDVLVHVGAVTKPAERLSVSGGISVMNGKGFVKGTDATKNTLQWRDANDNQQVDAGELIPVVGQSASPSYDFERWMAGIDLQIGIGVLPLGTTKLYGEVLLASNMDRALYVANPTLGGADSREAGYYVAVLQEVTRYGAVGFRYDYYDPNADMLGYKSGKLVPDNQTIKTYSPLFALMLPGQARLVFQYDFIRDHLAISPEGLPTDLANDTWTLRLQGEL